jgi:hypothetical protein
MSGLRPLPRMTGPALDEQAQRMLRQWRQLLGEDIPRRPPGVAGAARGEPLRFVQPSVEVTPYLSPMPGCGCLALKWPLA